MLANFGTSVSDILAKGKAVLSQYEITNISNEETAAYLRKWTTLEEVEPNVFLLYPEYVDMEGNVIPAQYIIL